VLAAAGFGRQDLYDTDPPPLRFSTIDDQIWDHMLAIYADRRGFLARLGFGLDVREVFPCPKPPEDELYKKHLSAPSAPQQPRLVVLPPSVFPALRPDQWRAIGISSVYRGWALIGGRNARLPDLKATVDIDGRRARLLQLVEELRDKQPRVFALDERSARFYQALSGVDGRSAPLPRPTILGSTSEESDALYQALVNDEADFVVGSAPTRALCEQAPAFKVYVDYVDLEELVEPRTRALISDPPMHEVWLVDRELDEPTRLRLASVLYYTVDYIRNYPEDFTRFLYDKAREESRTGRHPGGPPIGTRYIRNAVATCYQFTPLSLYSSTYLLANSPDYIGRLAGWPPAEMSSVYHDLMRYREKCFRWLELLSKDARGDLGADIPTLLERGKKHLQIYNFFDAEACFRTAYALWAGVQPGWP
jgi:hypothetical protein